MRKWVAYYGIEDFFHHFYFMWSFCNVVRRFWQKERDQRVRLRNTNEFHRCNFNDDI